MELKKVKGLNSSRFKDCSNEPDNVAGGKVITVGRVRVRVALLPKPHFEAMKILSRMPGTALSARPRCVPPRRRNKYRRDQRECKLRRRQQRRGGHELAVGGDFRRFPSAGKRQRPRQGQPARVERAHSL